MPVLVFCHIMMQALARNVMWSVWVTQKYKKVAQRKNSPVRPYVRPGRPGPFTALLKRGPATGWPWVARHVHADLSWLTCAMALGTLVQVHFFITNRYCRLGPITECS